MDMGSCDARGKVVLALHQLLVAGRVELLHAPVETPQLAKVNHIRYRRRAT
jgi:hypothetical protein